MFDVIENWLDRERDQLPLWFPVGIGVGVAIWRFGAISILTVLVLACTAIMQAGVPLCVIWAIAMIMAPRPDKLVTGDGKHMALVKADGEIALLCGQADDFVRDMIFEKAGSKALATPIEQWPGAKCTADNCVISIPREGRS